MEPAAMPPPRRNSVSAATPKRGSTTTGSPTPAGPPPAPARSPVPAPPPHDDLPAAVVRHHHEQQDHGSHPGIEPAGPRDEHDSDEFSLTDGYETASSSGSTSVTSSIYAHTFENGRRYQHFKNGRYPIPNDEDELNREDMKHAMLLELCDGALFFAPIGDRPQKILDIGTGTGVWAIEVGDRYPTARVRGVDVSPAQPIWVPSNVDFLVDDCEKEEWLDRDVDFVHFRFMTIVLKDIPRVLKFASESLKPGGWIELQELCGEVLCDDGTMPDNDPVKYLYEIGDRAFTQFGMNVTAPKGMEPLLRDAGFENIQCIVKKVPIGPWARDKTLRVIGMYQRIAVQDLMPALAGRPFTALGMSQVESQVTLAHARKGLADNSVHRYFKYYFWFAQKPS